MEFKGWVFLEVGPRGDLRRTGHVIDKISDGVYLCQVYANEFTAAQPVKAEEMMSWKMFPNKEDMQRFIKVSLEPAKAPNPDAPDTPEIERKPKPTDEDDLLADDTESDDGTDKG